MKPLKQRIDQYMAAKPVETTTLEVYNRILWVLEQELQAFTEAIWQPRTTSRRFRRLHAQRTRLAEDIAIIRAMHDRHLGLAGRPPGPPIPKTNAPRSPYGEA